jgi:ABC-type dipeptide/oligopeptide/nickel transport system permease component
MKLHAYVVRRLLLVIPTIISITLLIFAVTQLFSPTERVSLYITSAREATSANVDRMIAKYHLNESVFVQYYHWIKQVLHGNLGYSRSKHMPVLDAIISAFPATVELVIFSIPLIVLTGIYLGTISAAHHNKFLDHIARFFSVAGWSIPGFWFGLMLLALFYNWFPSGRLGAQARNVVFSQTFTRYTGFNVLDGVLNGQYWISLDALKHLVLPVINLTVVQMALIVRVMRSNMLEELSKPYITQAKGKGLSQSQVRKHARKNALLPVITLGGTLAAGLLTGVVITETVFNYYGLGYVAAHAAMQLDVSMVLGFVLIAGLIYIFVNLAIDIAYAYLDPRVRLG